MRIKDAADSAGQTADMGKRALITMLALALGAVTIAWTRHDRLPPGGARYSASGVVVTRPEGRRVRIRHGDITGYMPAMTMEFEMGVGETAELRAGDRVRFTLHVGPATARLERIEVTGHETGGSGPPPPRASVERLRRGDAVPSLSLVDQDGRTITEADLLGHATLVTFIFTRCPVPEFCPLVASRFTQVQAALASDRSLPRSARLLSVTIDPAFDTPAVLKSYAQAIGANPERWRFAGGDPDHVMRLARAFSVYVERNGALLDHTLATALIDGSGHVVEIWRGNGWKIGEIVDALRAPGL